MDTSGPEPEQKEQQQQQPPPPQQQQQQEQHDMQVHQPVPEQQFDLEADISQLEAPTFTTINRGPPEPMLRLRWDHRVNLIGEKVLNPMIHCCDKCLKPILIYGRMVRIISSLKIKKMFLNYFKKSHACKRIISM